MLIELRRSLTAMLLDSALYVSSLAFRLYVYEDKNSIQDLLYKRQRAGALEESEISFFIVFTWEIIALIFIANVISSICVSFLLQIAQSTSNFSYSTEECYIILVAKYITLIVQKIFLLCLTAIIFHHGDGFQGNIVVIKTGKATLVSIILILRNLQFRSFTSLIDGLHDGTHEFWTDSPGFVYDVVLQVYFRT